MKIRLKSPWFLLGVLPVLASVGVSYGTARLYWGHGFRPPTSHATLAGFHSLERFSTVWWPERHREGRAALFAGAANVNWIPGEYPLGRFPFAFVERDLVPTSALPVQQDLQLAAREALDRAGLLFAGDPGYAYAKELHGHFALGRNRAGVLLLAAALAGGEVSNDHYPYYEAVFSVSTGRTVTLLRTRHYWYDVAGLEGCAHILPAVFLVALVAAAWSVVGLLYLGRRVIHLAIRAARGTTTTGGA